MKKLTKSGTVRLVILILFFLFMILYAMQLTGYNEYNQNRKNMLEDHEIANFEKDVAEGKDVTTKDYLTKKQKNYNNHLSSAGLSLSKGIGDFFNDGMNAIFNMLGEAVTSG